MNIITFLKSIQIKIYFFFRKKLLFKDGYGLSYYLYRQTRPVDTLNIGVRSDDTTVLYVIDKILNSSLLVNSEEIECIDVGGYIGVVTLMMSKILRKSKKKWKIHTFEPFEDTFEKLKQNISLDTSNKNIFLNQIAVSDKSSDLQLIVNSNSPGETKLNINNLEIKKPSSKIQNVKVTTLRDYIIKNNIKKINICKIDTEGSDYFVIKGLHEFLEKKIVDFFIFEYELSTYENIKNLFFSKGYLIFFLVRNENQVIKSLENYPKNCKRLLNCVAVRQEQENNFIKKFNLK